MPEIVNPETHHERSDVNVRALLIFMAIFVVFAAISHFLLFGMFKFFAQMARNRTTAPTLCKIDFLGLFAPADGTLAARSRDYGTSRWQLSKS